MGFEGNINAAQINNVRNITQQGNVKVLQEGSSVRVVVIADKGNGKYQGSVAGVRVNITSKNPLNVGSSFVANVSSKNGIIQLTPQNNQINNFSAQVMVEHGQEQFNQYLSAFGLPQDSLSTSIMYQFKQLGMNFDSEVIRKIYTLAVRFKNKEKIAASLISILKEKGIETAETEIKKMIEELDFEQGEETYSQCQISQNHFEDEDVYNQLLFFINNLLNESQSENQKIGLLTISNHIKKSENGNGNWIFIPFEIVTATSQKIGNGNLKLLLNQSNVLNKILIEYFDEKASRFLLDFESDKLKAVKMNIDQLPEKEIDKKITELSKKLNGIKVEWFMKEELENTAALSEEIYSVGGLV